MASRVETNVLMEDESLGIASSSSGESTDILEPEDGEGEEGWEDVEPDVEEVKVVSLFDCALFSDVPSMIQHCKETYDFDLISVQKNLNLDYMETIKLVNYVRREGFEGNTSPNLATKSIFEADLFLQPALEDDALLYSIEDIFEGDFDLGGNHSLPRNETADVAPRQMNQHMQEKLFGTQLELRRCSERLDLTQKIVNRYETQLEDMGGKLSKANNESSGSTASIDAEEKDGTWTDPYGKRGIHRTMLEDKVRTEAYQKFILGNKETFRGKTVLDVGCGTGILSIFCAQAGAAQVIAVDSSTTIDAAREIIYANGFAKTITCVRGRIEDVTLPVRKVDIIVSEWMGYCLLYEGMLSSVLFARDRYLVRDGLMIPSHTTLRIAPLTAPDHIKDLTRFWRNVYGLDMTAMARGIEKEVILDFIGLDDLPASSQPFLSLDIHSTTAEELRFQSHPFTFQLLKTIPSLDGFVIWFDTFFTTRADGPIPSFMRAHEFVSPHSNSNAFTTGPSGANTHWYHPILLAEHRDSNPKEAKKGSVIRGSISYGKAHRNDQLKIKIQWDLARGLESGSQTWRL